MMMTPRLESKPSISTSSWFERLLALVVAADGRAAARLAQGVQLVDENDARGLVLGLAEEIAHPGGPDADEHLDEVGAAQAEEGHLGLAGHGLGQQRLAGARRTDQQHALGNPAAQRPGTFRRLEEIDHLAQLGHRLVDAGHVAEGDFQVFLGVQLGPAAAKASTASRRPTASAPSAITPRASPRNSTIVRTIE